MYKGLVTSGCSFSLWDSVDGNGWPCFLQESLLSDGILSEDFDSFHRGVGGNGNMLIARYTVEAISKLLDKGLNGEDILCVVQWSDISRHGTFLEDDYYLMYSSDDELSEIYYKYFHDHTNDVINSLWNWMALQNYCETNNIKPYYTFMFEHDKELLLDDDLGDTWAWKYLRDNIITDNVLTSITKYLEEHSHKNLFVPDGHPNKRGHKVFSDYLKKSLTNI